MSKILRKTIGGLVGIMMVLPVLAFGASVQGVLERPAMEVRDPAGCVLLDVALAGDRLVAVGEHGVITYSDDAGDTWRQAQVPVSVSLTSVCFPDALDGWAIGHGGVVLHTTDGGETWGRQLEGLTVAQMALENAQAQADADPDDFDAQAMVNNAQLLVEDGPDKPFLDLYFKNDREGMIIGAYGIAFKTEDGGASWKCIMDSIENPDALNLYGICAAGDSMYIAGEQGLFLVSRDGGASFQQANSPYYGTFFDVYAYPTGQLVLVGLQGNAYWSADRGETFSKSLVDAQVSFTKVVNCEHDILLFANQGGMLLESRDQGKTIQALDVRLNPVSSLVQMSNGDHDGHIIMTVGYGGAVRVQLPSSDSSDKGGQ
jgi:photosystem II stability/assembly factor-like uncharacterized protein